MSKARLEFDLDDPDDKLALSRALKATDMSLFLFQLSTNLKKRCEHIADVRVEEGDMHDGIELVFDEIQRLFEEYNINIDELIS